MQPAQNPLVQAIAGPAMACDAHGTIVSVNQAGLRWLQDTARAGEGTAVRSVDDLAVVLAAPSLATAAHASLQGLQDRFEVTWQGPQPGAITGLRLTGPPPGLLLAVQPGLAPPAAVEGTRPMDQMATARLSATISGLPEAVLVEDEERRIVAVNKAFLALFGIPADPDHLVGTDCSRAAEQTQHLFADPGAFVERITKLLADRKQVVADHLTMVDGRQLERDYTPIWVDADYRGHLWIYRDITPRTETRAASEGALAAAAAGADFAAAMSHQFRTPLHALAGTAEILNSDRQPDNYRELLGVLHTSASALSHLMDDMLDFSRLASGAVEAVTEAVDVRATLHDVMDLFSLDARQRDVTLEAPIGELPASVVTDVAALRDVFTSLISNAVRASAGGRVWVTAGIDGDQLAVEVHDSGPGIDASLQHTLFEPFAPGRPRGTGRPGTGLGLAISARRAREAGGTLSLDATGPDGSTFRLVLPASPGRTDTTETPADTAQPGQQRSLTVLVVEDDDMVQVLASAQLEALGHRAIVVTDGLPAVEAVRRGNIDLVLMDRNLVTMDGPEAARAIRALPSEASRTPIVALTAAASTEDHDVCLDAGMDRFLVKPVSLDALRRLIAGLDEDGRLRREAASDQDATDHDDEAFRATLSQVQARLAQLADEMGDAGPLRAAGQQFVDTLAERVAAVADGVDPEARSRAAHTLAGAAETLGAMGLGRAARAIMADPGAEAVADDLLAALHGAAGLAERAMRRYLSDAT